MASLDWRHVFIREVIEKKDIAVFRCTISRQPLHRWVGIPTWMFDRVVSASWRITDAPHVDLAALRILVTLLRDAHSPSQYQGMMGAGFGSDDANRGDVLKD